MSDCKSSEYNRFRSSIAQKKIIVSNGNGDEMWTVFDAGPKHIRYPIVFLPPCSGSADVFYKQLLFLSSIGYRVISINYPVLWNCEDWCSSFIRLLDKLNVFQVHIFGASLGGFLAQKFVEYSKNRASRVVSMILCNSFSDTGIFNMEIKSKLFWLMPKPVLTSTLVAGLSAYSCDLGVRAAALFMKKKLYELTREELASRLTLSCSKEYVNPTCLQNMPVTIIDVNDRNALTEHVNFNLLKCYPQAKRAHMKSGGNFPYLSRSVDTNIFIQVHMNQFADGPLKSNDPNYNIVTNQRPHFYSDSDEMDPSSSSTQQQQMCTDKTFYSTVQPYTFTSTANYGIGSESDNKQIC